MTIGLRSCRVCQPPGASNEEPLVTMSGSFTVCAPAGHGRTFGRPLAQGLTGAPSKFGDQSNGTAPRVPVEALALAKQTLVYNGRRAGDRGPSATPVCLPVPG